MPIAVLASVGSGEYRLYSLCFLPAWHHLPAAPLVARRSAQPPRPECKFGGLKERTWRGGARTRDSPTSSSAPRATCRFGPRTFARTAGTPGQGAGGALPQEAHPGGRQPGREWRLSLHFSSALRTDRARGEEADGACSSGAFEDSAESDLGGRWPVGPDPWAAQFRTAGTRPGRSCEVGPRYCSGSSASRGAEASILSHRAMRWVCSFCVWVFWLYFMFWFFSLILIGSILPLSEAREERLCFKFLGETIFGMTMLQISRRNHFLDDYASNF